MFGSYLYIGKSNKASFDKIGLSYHILLVKASCKASPDSRDSKIEHFFLGGTKNDMALRAWIQGSH